MDVDQVISKFFIWFVPSLALCYVMGHRPPFNRHRFIYTTFTPVWLSDFLLRLRAPKTNKAVYISDPRALQEILVKENDTVFTHVPGHFEINNLIFGPGLFGTSGATHKLQRKALNPVFTTFQTKSMASKMESTAQEMVDMIVSTMEGDSIKEINILEWCKVVTLEIIGQAGFGYKFGAIRGNHSSYLDAMQRFLPTVAPLYGFRHYIYWIPRLIPRELLRRLIGWVPSKYMQDLKKMVDTQTKYSKDILQSRKTLVSNSAEGDLDDILSALIRANARARDDARLPENQIRGQINTLVFAGFETTSSSLARIIHLLAEHPNIQNRLRTELQGMNPDQDIDKLPYLNAIVRETLRLHPPVPTIQRYATKDWILPLRYPTNEQKREIFIKKGTTVMVSLSRANRSIETWGKDAEEFRPERWLNSLPRSVPEAKLPGVYSPMMTFAAGPRSCIGYKFAVLELKIVLARLIKAFRFAPGREPIEWRSRGCISPHIVKNHEDGTMIADESPSLPLTVSVIH